MRASNEKLQDRAVRILMDEAKIDEAASAKLMEDAGGDLRVALVMRKAQVDADSAKTALANSEFVVEKAIASFEPVSKGNRRT